MAGIRVLVVDDDEIILRLMQRYFTQRGDICMTAADGSEALRLIEDRFFELLLADINMPEMGGLELVSKVRSMQPHTVCILISGGGTRCDLISALKAGVFDFVDKPITNLTEFGMIIDRAAANSRLLQERDALVENLKQQNARLEFSLLRLHEAFAMLREQEQALESDLVKAQRVQRKFLPDAFPQVNGLDLYGYFEPCDHIGGDFFGAIPLNDGRVAVYMVDVTGHGVSAAMITVTVRELMRVPQRREDAYALLGSPPNVLTFMNEALLAEAFDPPIFVSMIYAVIDPRSGRVCLSSAGHPAPLHVAADGTESTIGTAGPVLGVPQAGMFPAVEMTLGPGDVMLIYSDGLPDARDAKGRELTAEHVREVLARCHAMPARAIGEAIESALAVHRNRVAAEDDVTFIVIGRTPTEQPQVDTYGHPVPAQATRSVKIAAPNRVRASPRATQGRLRAGWTEKQCVVRVSGIATWQLAATLRAMLEKARADRATAIAIDLSQCDSMDSTMLGLLLQHADEIRLHQAGPRVVRQMHDMGVLDRFSLDPGPCPAPVAPMAIEKVDTQEACSDLILAAHEALMEASTDNQERFKDVVSALRDQQVPAR